ncbi:MAG: response regulator [Treponema sp.]|jgi:DNA-binding NtrC family response regulator|nr:response regulator [Treponema sp.]
MKHVIHADNSEFFRKQMKTYLTEAGLDSENFERGEDIVKAAKEGKASFVITGLELSDMSGEELLKRLMVLPKKIPVIVVTSNEDAARTKRIEALGVKATILKSGDWRGELGKHLGA